MIYLGDKPIYELMLIKRHHLLPTFGRCTYSGEGLSSPPYLFLLLNVSDSELEWNTLSLYPSNVALTEFEAILLDEHANFFDFCRTHMATFKLKAT